MLIGPIVYIATISVPKNYDGNICIEIHASPNGPASEAIPEITTIAIPVAAIIGLFFFFFNHRKRRKNE